MEFITKTAKSRISKIFSFTKADAVDLVFAFLLGRVVFFDCLSPFAPAFLAAYAATNPNKTVRAILVAAAAIFGALTADLGLGLAKYILAFILFGLIHTAITAVTEKCGIIPCAASASVALAASGAVFLGQYGGIYYALMLVTECVMCFCISIFAAKALNYDNPTRESVIGFCFLAALTVVGFGDISVGNISVGKIIAGIYILTVSYCGGLSGGAAGGIAIGILYSFSSYPETEAIGIFSVCGLCCGFFAKYRRLGIICGYAAANIILYIYLGSSSASLLSVYDVLISAIVFCLIPKTALATAENIVRAALPDNADAKKAVADMCKKLSSLSEKLREVAGDAGYRQPKNRSDIMCIFDKAADKVCKRCGLKFVCWEKEFNATYDRLLHHAPLLQKYGKIEKNAVARDFKTSCIYWEQFADEINRVYARFKLDTIWTQKIEASKTLLSQHLRGVADVMESFADDAVHTSDIISNADNVLYLALKKRGVRCVSTAVIKNTAGQCRVYIKARETDENKLADITSEILGRRFYIKESKKSDKKISVCLLERERYGVVTGAAARTKDGSKKSGDSYCQKKLEHNKYLAVLSDGMGSGENARSQSLYAVNIMMRLLNCGFNKECAVKIMNLSLFLRQTKESFATVDAAVIDLFEGSAEFIKIGAAQSYLKRGKNVKKITSNSLPAGMITEISPCTQKTQIEKGDIIVLATDGVSGFNDDWLADFLANSTENNPQKLSESIVKEAVIKNDHTAKDDMTVIALQINEEIA